MKLFGPKDIKLFVKNILLSRRSELTGRTVVDVPAGSGYSSEILHSLGARVEPYDLFPEFFKVEGLACRHGDLGGRLPIADAHADFVLCQEGVEHLPDQLQMFRELNRVLKRGGILFLTTPNYSMLRSRLSYLLSESEYAGKKMPPNELESVWFTAGGPAEIYYGHIFLVGIQKLRVFARLAGFRIRKLHHLRINHTSLLLFPFLYPLILFSNLASYAGAVRANHGPDAAARRETYREILKLGIDPRVLLGGHLFVEFEKVHTCEEAAALLNGKFPDTERTT